MSMSDKIKMILVCALSVLFVAALIIPVALSNRAVASRTAIGTIEWFEPLEAVDTGLTPSVDAQGQISQSVSVDIDSSAVIGTTTGRWLVDGKARFGKGDALVLEVRKSGRKYICLAALSQPRRCNRVRRWSAL